MLWLFESCNSTYGQIIVNCLGLASFRSCNVVNVFIPVLSPAAEEKKEEKKEESEESEDDMGFGLFD